MKCCTKTFLTSFKYFVIEVKKLQWHHVQHDTVDDTDEMKYVHKQINWETEISSENISFSLTLLLPNVWQGS